MPTEQEKKRKREEQRKKIREAIEEIQKMIDEQKTDDKDEITSP